MTQFAVIRYGSALALAQVYTATLIPIHMTQFALLPQTSTADCNPCTSQRQCSTKREKEKNRMHNAGFFKKTNHAPRSDTYTANDNQQITF